MIEQPRPDPTDRGGRDPRSHDGVVAAALLSWCRRPRLQANRAVVTVGVLTMTWITVFAWPMPDRVTFLRNVALMFAATHGTWHVLVRRGLRRLCARGVAGADEALASYLDPLRISHLDLAAAWLAFALGMRLVDWAVSASVTATGG